VPPEHVIGKTHLNRAGYFALAQHILGLLDTPGPDTTPP
jgi:hypothetical protein